jgi:hypothetical protein
MKDFPRGLLTVSTIRLDRGNSSYTFAFYQGRHLLESFSGYGISRISLALTVL